MLAESGKFLLIMRDFIVKLLAHRAVIFPRIQPVTFNVMAVDGVFQMAQPVLQQAAIRIGMLQFR
ncbi:hypothetical protein D3C80_1887290 [compost metagenome]